MLFFRSKIQATHHHFQRNTVGYQTSGILHTFFCTTLCTAFAYALLHALKVLAFHYGNGVAVLAQVLIVCIPLLLIQGGYVGDARQLLEYGILGQPRHSL